MYADPSKSIECGPWIQADKQSSESLARGSTLAPRHQTKRAAPKDRPDLLPDSTRLEVAVGLVADEPHRRDLRALGHREHLVDQLVAGLRIGLQVKLRG